MNLIELQRALRQLRLGGIAEVLETRLHQAQTEAMAPIDLVSRLVSDELDRRSIRLLEWRRKQARFRDPQKTLDSFDFTFNKKMNRSLVFDQRCRWLEEFLCCWEEASASPDRRCARLGRTVIGFIVTVLYTNPRQTTTVSRSFGAAVSDPEELGHAITEFATDAARGSSCFNDSLFEFTAVRTLVE